MSDTPSTSTLIHWIDQPTNERAVCGSKIYVDNCTGDVGVVTCFSCRANTKFKAAQRGVGAPTTLPQREMPVLLRDVIADSPTLAALADAAEFKLTDHRNYSGNYRIEELIHHGNYRNLRTVEVYDLTPATVDAVLISSAYCYGSWLNAEAPHTEHRRAALLELVQDLRHGRVNRSIGWSTFRLV